MHGFIAVISLENNIPEINFQWKNKFSFQNDFTKSTAIGQFYKAERFIKNTFSLDKIWVDNKKILGITEGIILNTNSFCLKHKIEHNHSAIAEHILTHPKLLNEFNGNYCGFFFNKDTRKFIAFNNHTATQKIFYYKNESYLIVSTDLFTLSKTLDLLKLSKTLDRLGTYFLLTCGFMQENHTLIDEVKQLNAGEYLHGDQESFLVERYFNLNEIEYSTQKYQKTIDNLDCIFKESVKAEFEFDKIRNLNSQTTLSGGLDSRMTALIGHELGYNKQHLINFSQEKYADHIIANQISDHYKLELQHINITEKSLNYIDETVLVNDGLTSYLNSSLLFEVLPQITINRIGLLHTGLLGDAILGSYLTNKQNVLAKPTNGNYSNILLNKINYEIEKNIKKYKSEEIYKFYNRGFNGINNGCQYYNLTTESISPFLYPEFISYALSIPRDLRYKERIYIDWINNLHKPYTQFIWENIGGKPTNNQILKLLYRTRRAIVKRLPIKSMWKSSMNPEQEWYNENIYIQNNLKKYFWNNIENIDIDTELKEDLIILFNTQNIVEKAHSITFICAYKLLFQA
ncbi:MAG: asparagine synthase-related protein [Paludibacter sp.]|nr:asparagine synthase-related protein [Paludibacter sp.]